jgi:hypothetical protein
MNYVNELKINKLKKYQLTQHILVCYEELCRIRDVMYTIVTNETTKKLLGMHTTVSL